MQQEVQREEQNRRHVECQCQCAKRKIGQGLSIFQVYQRIEPDADTKAVSQQVQNNHSAVHRYEQHEYKGDVLNVKLPTEPDKQNEVNDSTCNIQEDILVDDGFAQQAKDQESWFSKVFIRYVKLQDVAPLNISKCVCIQYPVGIDISSKTEEQDKDNDRRKGNIVLFLLFLGIVIEKSAYSHEQQ
jgi:hypothetical protein